MLSPPTHLIDHVFFVILSVKIVDQKQSKRSLFISRGVREIKRFMWKISVQNRPSTQKYNFIDHSPLENNIAQAF